MLRKVIFIGICFFLFCIAISFWAYQSAINGPQFYRDLVQKNEPNSRSLGDQLENIILELHNSAVRESEWSLEVTESQINAWIEDHLPRKYPRQNPNQIEDPRVKISDGEIKLAFRLKSSSFPAVICIHLSPFITADGNNLGLKISRSYMGFLPVGKKRIIEQLSSAAGKLKIPIAWSQDKNAPVALVSPKFELAKELERKIEINSIQIVGSSLVLSGTASDTN